MTVVGWARELLWLRIVMFPAVMKNPTFGKEHCDQYDQRRPMLVASRFAATQDKDKYGQSLRKSA